MGIMVLAAFLRFYLIDSESLWYDEAMSHHYVKETSRELWGGHTHPPAYYILLYYWTILGESEFVLRSMSAVIGIMTVPLIFGLGRTMGTTAIGLLAAFIFAISPFQIKYGQEARMYALLTFGATLAMWGFVWIVNNVEAASVPLRRLFFQLPKTLGISDADAWAARGAWLIFVLGTVLSIYSHNTFFLFILAANIVFWGCCLFQWRQNRGMVWNCVLVNLSIVILWGFYWPNLLRQSAQVLHDFWIPFVSVGVILQSIPSIFFFSAHTLHGGLIEIAVNYFVFGLALLGLTTWTDKKCNILFCLAFIIIAPWGLYLVSVYIQPIFLKRAIIWTSIPFIIALSAGLLRIKKPMVTAPLIVIVLTGYALSDVDYYRTVKKPQWQSTIEFFSKRVKADDFVIMIPDFAVTPFNYYTRHLALKNRTHYVNDNQPDFMDKLKTEMDDLNRVWVVATGTAERHGFARRDILSFLKIDYDIIDQHHSYKIGTFLLEPDRADWGSAAAFMAERIQPDDLIVLNPGMMDFSFERHAGQYSFPNRRHHVENTRDDFIDKLKINLKGHRRIWLVSAGTDESIAKPKKFILNHLGKAYSKIAEHHPHKIGVYLFGLPTVDQGGD